MVVPVCVPAVAGRTVVHNTIVYSDTVLNLKERGKNLKVTSVSVSKYLFEHCIRMILEENPEVVFNTVQYSYQQEKAFFYTDKPISTEKWEKRNQIKKDYLADNSSIETHIKELLASDRTMNPGFVALYDVLCLSKRMHHGIKSFEDNIESRIKHKLRLIDDDYYVTIHDMKYETCECNIVVSKYYRYSDDSKEEFWFKKIGDDVYISKRDGRYLMGDKILGIIGDEISELYDYQVKIRYKEKEPTVYVKAVNSSFSVAMGYFGVDIYNGKILNSTFKVEMYSYSGNINYNCNSASLMQLLKGNVYELYKKIFVKIDDCPKWMQEELYEIRRQQVIEEEKERQKKLKKQKRREFWKKIIPLIK